MTENPTDLLRKLADKADPADVLRAIYESDADPEDKCDIAMNFLKFARPDRVDEILRALRATIFANTEARTHMVVRGFTNSLRTRSGPVSSRQKLEAASEMLDMSAFLLDDISAEAAKEVMQWGRFFEEMVRNSRPRDTYECAHCGGQRDDMYAVMDEWVLCLTTSDGTPSCFTRVHDYGEALGSGKG